MIEREHEMGITRQAKLLEISRGTVYYLPRPVSPADLALMREIDELHLEHPLMGACMLRGQLARQGIHAGRGHIRTLTLRMGIEALAPQPGISKAAPGHKIYPYLLRKLAIVQANQVWGLDTTCIPIARGFVYLTAVVDVISRCVLAHEVAITLEAVHAKEVIEQAFARYGALEIVNTDQGSQFTAEEFTSVVLAKGCKLSMDGRGAWLGNVFVECLWRSVKYKRASLKAYDSVSAARIDIAAYSDWYNAHRGHCTNGSRRTHNTSRRCRRWCSPRKMKSSARPELSTAALRSSQATHAAVDNSAPLATRPESTYKSGKVVQTNEATSMRPLDYRTSSRYTRRIPTCSKSIQIFGKSSSHQID